MKKLLIIYLLTFCSVVTCLEAQHYSTIRTWSPEVNSRLESFLDSTMGIAGKKVAVFDCDGTVFGQVPYYLADEALYRYADKVLRKRDEDVAREKMAILSRMVENGNNVGKIYGKASTIETFIKARPLIVGGNSRGDMDMLNESSGLKIIVNPDDITVRGTEDGEMHGYTVKSYWEKHGALIVRCKDVTDPDISFHTAGYKIKQNQPNP